MRVLDQLFTEPETCGYLPDRKSRMEYRIAVDVHPETMDRLLERGWRRFGYVYFRPACDGCMECVSLRVPVATFRPSRSQRRVAERGARLMAAFGAPRLDEARLELLRRWHREREATRGWKRQDIDEERYELEFAAPNACARELTWWDAGGAGVDAAEGRAGADRAGSAGTDGVDDADAARHEDDVEPSLVAVALVDETPTAFSAIYTFYDPAYAAYSPGTLSILRLIDLASARGKTWVYLGYRIAGCASSEYKAKFVPHELAVGWPDLGERGPEWG